jgi:hypothetical protein
MNLVDVSRCHCNGSDVRLRTDALTMAHMHVSSSGMHGDKLDSYPTSLRGWGGVKVQYL